MTPSWYDVLDVAPDASAADIRAAWREGIADLDPADRRFRLLNQAAEVLLDPARRAEHDAALAGDDEAGGAGGAGVEAPAAKTATRSTTSRTTGAGAEAGAGAGVGAGAGTTLLAPANVAQATDTEAETEAEPDEKRARRAAYAGWAPPLWLLGAAVVLVAALVVLAFVLRAQVPTQDELQARIRDAQATAETTAVTVLSYDYRDMQATQDAANGLLTGDFRNDYDQLFATLEANAASVQPVVTATVIASGVERVDPGADRVNVLVFLNRPTTNAATSTPQISQDQVLMSMQLVDGQWLLDDMATTPASQ